MASTDFPADRRLAVPSAKAITKPTSITWLTKGPYELERLGHGIVPKRFGVRIEDIVLATEDGGQRLNNTNHEMYIVS